MHLWVDAVPEFWVPDTHPRRVLAHLDHWPFLPTPGIRQDVLQMSHIHKPAAAEQRPSLAHGGDSAHDHVGAPVSGQSR